VLKTLLGTLAGGFGTGKVNKFLRSIDEAAPTKLDVTGASSKMFRPGIKNTDELNKYLVLRGKLEEAPIQDILQLNKKTPYPSLQDAIVRLAEGNRKKFKPLVDEISFSSLTPASRGQAVDNMLNFAEHKGQIGGGVGSFLYNILPTAVKDRIKAAI